MTSALLVALTFAIVLCHIYEARIAATNLALPAGIRRRMTTRAELVTIGLLSVSALLVHTGLFTHFNSKLPNILRYIGLHIMLAVGIGLSPYGKRLAMGLPVVALVGFQSFRIFVELIMHQAYRSGLLPAQMTFTGRNLDIISGLTAVIVAIFSKRGHAPRWLLYIWNVMALGLLINVIVIAFLSTPGPLQVFHNNPPNTLFVSWPGIWIPTFLAPTALLGHIVLFRRLMFDSQGRRNQPTIARS